MQIKKYLTAAVLVCIFTVASCSEALAAGLGIVDFYYLEQHHPSFSSAIATYQADIKQYQTEYTSKSQGVSDQQKQGLAAGYNQQLNNERIRLFGPIDKSIMDSISKVKTAKGLDYIVAKGYLLSGSDGVDITNDVAQQLGEK